MITFVFFLLYGPVEVALPIHVQHDLHGSAAVLGSFWTLFATGEVIGGPVVASIGARGTLLLSAVATLALGVTTAAAVAVSSVRRSRPTVAGATPTTK